MGFPLGLELFPGLPGMLQNILFPIEIIHTYTHTDIVSYKNYLKPKIDFILKGQMRSQDICLSNEGLNMHRTICIVRYIQTALFSLDPGLEGFSNFQSSLENLSDKFQGINITQILFYGMQIILCLNGKFHQFLLNPSLI